MKSLYVLFIALTLSGCASNGTKIDKASVVPVTNNEARIYLMRKKGIYGFADSPNPELNGRETDGLSIGEAVLVDVKPGRQELIHSGLMGLGKSSIRFDLRGGQTAYVLVGGNTNYMIGTALGGAVGVGVMLGVEVENNGPYRFDLIEKSQAEEILSELSLTALPVVFDAKGPLSAVSENEPNGLSEAAPEAASVPMDKSGKSSVRYEEATNIADRPSGKGTAADRLRVLKDLYEEGVLTKEEYDSKKMELIGEI